MNEVMSRIKYASIVLGTAAASYFVLVQPAYRARRVVHVDVAALKARVSQAEADFDGRDRARKRFALLEERLATETKPVPESGDVAGVISGISTDIRELELSGAKLNRGKDSALGSTASSGLLIETTGRFDAIVELLHRIESLPRLVRISSLTAENVNHATGEVRATIGLDAYYRIVSETASAASGHPGGGRE